MQAAITFLQDVETGTHIENLKIPIPESLMDITDLREPVSIQEATRRGYDLRQVRDVSEADCAFDEMMTRSEALSESEQKRYLGELAEGIPKMKDGKMLLRVPDLETRRVQYLAELTGKQVAVRSFETLEIPIQELQVTAQTMPAKMHKVQALQILPTPNTVQGKIFVADDKVKKNYLLHPEKESLAVRICHFLQENYMLRIFNGLPFKFDAEVGHYRQLKSRDLDYLINENFREEIEKESSCYVYDVAKSFLSREAHLVVPDNYQIPEGYFIFQDIILDAMTGQTWRNDGNFFVTNSLQCAFDPRPICPLFDKFIFNVTGGDEVEIELIWEVLGYIFSNDMAAKTFFVFVGKKDTGKSLLGQVIENIIGKSATTHLSLNDFGGRFDRAELCGAHLNVCMDLPATPISADAIGMLKAYTGNDDVRSDVKNQAPISFRPTAHLLFGSNHALTLAHPDDALMERMVTVPFLNRVPKEKQDPQLLEKLLEERVGICARAVEAYRRLRENHYRFPSVATEMSQGGVDVKAVFSDFMTENCLITENDSDVVPLSTLYGRFSTFCTNIGVNLGLSLSRFSSMFKESVGEQCGSTKRRCQGFANPVSVVTRLRLRSEL